MKVSNNSVRSLLPKSATLFWVKPLPSDRPTPKTNDYGMLDKAVSKQLKKKKKKQRGLSYS